MPNLTSAQKAKTQNQILAWQEELSRTKTDDEPSLDIAKEGKNAFKELEKLKKDFAKNKDSQTVEKYTDAFARVAASVVLLYRSNIIAAGNLNKQFVDMATNRLGIGSDEINAFMRQMTARDLEKQTVNVSQDDYRLMEEQLLVEEPKKEVKQEEPKKEEPKKEVKKEVKKEEPKPEPEKQKKPSYKDQKNLPKVKGTMPSVIVEGALNLMNADEVPTDTPLQIGQNGRKALDQALASRTEFQTSRSQESRDEFYRNMATALLCYSRIVDKMDTSVSTLASSIRTRMENDFGISLADLRNAASVIYSQERQQKGEWTKGDEAKLEDRLLKIGAPNLESTEVIQKPVEEPQAEVQEPVKNEAEIEVAPVVEEPEEKTSITVDLQSAPVRKAKAPETPAISSAQIAEMKKQKELLAKEKNDTAVINNFITSFSSYKENLKNPKTKDEAIGKLFAIGERFQGTGNDSVVNGAKSLLFDNTFISKSEIDVAMESLGKPNADIAKDLTDLKAREFEEKYSVPDKIKNFKYSRQMIDVNKKFFANDYDIKKGDFLAFARKNIETLQERAKNPPEELIGGENGTNPQKELLDASIGTYARIRSSYDKKNWFDVLRHPIDSYREYSLLKSMKNTMMDNGMNEQEIESLYTEAKDVFEIDKLSNGTSLNGKLNPEEANDKLVDIKEENPDREPIESLDKDLKNQKELEQKSEKKEFTAPTVSDPTANINI